MKVERTWKYIQYGCGCCAPDTWLNFDTSPTLWFERLALVGKLEKKAIHKMPC